MWTMSLGARGWKLLWWILSKENLLLQDFFFGCLRWWG